MKKQVIALAVAAAVAAPAMAQNVSITGRFDTSVGSAKNSAGENTSRVQSSVITSNQIVIAGSEDLGGGLKAKFDVLTGFASDAANNTSVNATGVDAAGATTSVGTMALGDRGMQLTVMGGFGEIAVGRMVTTMLNATTASGKTGNIGNLSTLDARPNNAVSFQTPAISGITARVIHAVGNEKRPVQGKQTEISVAYANGPVAIKFAQANYTNATIKGVKAETFDIFGTSSSAVSDADKVTDPKVKETGGSIDYNAGFAALNVRFQNRKHDTATSSDFDSTGIGASFPLGNGLTAAVDYVKVDVNAASSDSTVTSAALIKDLSKRTNVYFAYANKNLEDTTKKSNSLMAVGLRHSF